MMKMFFILACEIQRTRYTDTRTILVICMVGNYIATIVSETKVAEEVFGLNNADLFNVQTGYIQC